MQRCVFCQAEFEETADSCPACGQQPPTTELEAPQPLESASITEPLPAAALAAGVESEEAVLPAAPGEEQDSQPLPQDQAPAQDAAPRATPGVRFTKLWRQPYAKVLAIILAVIVVAAGSGAIFYVLTLPRPVLSVSGPRQVGSIPAGSPDQVLRVSGQHFSANSAITFLLDGKAAPGAPKVQSDGSGNFTVNLPITDDWLVGSHSLSAKDAKGYATHTAQQVQILPAPVLLITSQYQQDAIPAGSAGTSLHLSGKRFPLRVSISLFIDDQPFPGGPFSSDARGRLDIDWTVPAALAVGTHMVTAQDAQGDTTASGAPMAIVQQGDAGTPGPNGAPANDASFSIGIEIPVSSPPGFVGTMGTLNVTGHPDPAGGTVCGSNDDGQPHTDKLMNTDGSVFGTITTTYGCSGTYTYGHLTYTETVVHIVFKFLSGFLSGTICAGGGYTSRQLQGTFTNATTISGTAHYPDAPPIPCNRFGDITMLSMGPQNSTWTGLLEGAPQG